MSAHKIFVYAIVTENFDDTKTVSQNLNKIKEEVAKRLGTDRLMLQNLS